VNAAVTGLTALPSTATAMASVKAMSRFLHNEAVPLAALIEPAQEAIRAAVAQSASPQVLVLHDWSTLCPGRANSDRMRASKGADLGYHLGTALVVDAADGQPLGPMELRLRTAEAVHTTRPGAPAIPSGHINELLGAMAESRRWNLGCTPVHIVDREGDSLHHYREWHGAHHRFVVRADAIRVVRFQGQEIALGDLAKRPDWPFQNVAEANGSALRVATADGAGRVQVAEVSVVLHRGSQQLVDGRRVYRPGEPLPLRLVISRVVTDDGTTATTWLLLTNLPSEVPAATVAQWYAWRWRIESYHKLLKTAGQNVERWEQTTGEAIAKRLVLAAMACLVVWHLQRDPRPEAAGLRRILIRLSGRLMKHKVESTAPALLAGLEKLLALDDLQQDCDLNDVLAMARNLLPQLFRSG